MLVHFNPAINFKADSPLTPETSVPAKVINPVQEQEVPKNNNTSLKVGNIFIATSSVIKGLIYGFLAGTAVATYHWVTRAIPDAAKKGLSLIDTLQHPAKSIGWKGNLYAGVTALGVGLFHIIRGKVKNDQRKINAGQI